MEAISKKAVVAAACALVALSVLGVYQGWRRSAADEAQTGADGSLLPTTAAVAGARQASALVEAPPAPLTEAQIRDIARQEVRSALRGDSASSSESAPAAGAAPGAVPPRPNVPTPPPVIAPTPPPASTEPAGAAPLF